MKNQKLTYGVFTFVGIVVGALVSMFMFNSNQGGDAVVAEFNGKSVRASDAFGNVKTRIFELEEEMFRTKEQAIQEYIDQRLLEAESKKQNLSPDQLVEKEMGGGAVNITDEQISEFLKTKGLTLNDPRIKKDDVKEYLKYKNRFDKRLAYVSKLRQTANVKIKVKEPESPKLNVAHDDGYGTWGNPKAKVTIYEFSDFQCPFCSRAVETLARIKKEYGPDQVRVVFRDMPLPNHPRANFASLAAHCAKDQGKFWEMYGELFKNQAKLEDSDIKKYAKSIGLEEGKFSECYSSKKYQALIDKSKKEAETLGIQATPSFIINGQLLQGAQPFERFKEKIDRAKRS
jgi:protein-disulfide isomerase